MERLHSVLLNCSFFQQYLRPGWKKSISIGCLLVVAAISSYAQSISREVLSASGGTFTGGSNTITYTIGETVIPTLTAGGSTIT
ncbi:MAG: hypothetical protein ABIN36_11790 [Ferruginibacter sp.]